MFSKLIKLLILASCLLVLILLRSLFLTDQVKPEYLYFQGFEKMAPGQQWFDAGLIAEQSKDVENNSLVIRQNYIPSSSGTPYIGKRFKLGQSVTAATLSFDMKLDPRFEFVKGGKMHGLGGGTATTGCKTVDANGWSVRLMWREQGKPVLYIYDQDRKSRCGDDIENQTGFTFHKGIWYNIAIYVKLNSGIGSADGVAALYINGKKLIERNGLNLTGNMSSKIDYFMYNSFYGGNDQSWSPSTITFVYYDNFKVVAGSLNTSNF